MVFRLSRKDSMWGPGSTHYTPEPIPLALILFYLPLRIHEPSFSPLPAPIGSTPAARQRALAIPDPAPQIVLAPRSQNQLATSPNLRVRCPSRSAPQALSRTALAASERLRP